MVGGVIGSVTVGRATFR